MENQHQALSKATVMRAIEADGHIDERGMLKINNPLSVSNKKVRVIILLEEEELDEESWLKNASSNQAFDFLNDAEEDIYTVDDGEAFSDEV